MGYRIGEAFSDAVFGAVERARDRAAAHPYVRSREGNLGLRAAMLRAAQDERENETRRELGLATIDANRERYAASDATDRADLERKRSADTATQDYHQGLLDQQASNAEDLAGFRSDTLDLRAQEGADRASRFKARGKYEERVAGIREREAAADEERAAVARDAQALRAAAEGVRSVNSARSLLLRAKDLATRPDPSTGVVNPDRARVFIPLIREIEAMLTGESPVGKRLPGEVGDHARKARAAIAAAAGIGGVDDSGDEVDPLLDLGLDSFGDEEERPPRLGR